MKAQENMFRKFVHTKNGIVVLIDQIIRKTCITGIIFQMGKCSLQDFLRIKIRKATTGKFIF